MKPEAEISQASSVVTDEAEYRLGEDFAQLRNASIMMVDDEPITMEVVQTFLEDAGYRKFILIDDSLQAMDRLREQHPDVLLLDVVMPGLNGFEILSMVRADPEFTHLPVIILTSSSDAATKLQALDLGATDFLSKPVDPSELALRVRNTLAAKAYQDHLAFYDVLTNLPNRRLFQDRAEWAIRSAQREQDKVAMVHIAFDDFKRITDTFGPSIGDEVLKQLAARLADNVRGTDSLGRDIADASSWVDVFRLGSADFSLLLPSIDGVARAALVGQRLLKAMDAPFDADGTDVYLTPSIGVAAFPDDADDVSTLIKLAMGASSQAIMQGGGRIKFYSSELNQASLQRLRMEADLRRAVENEEFRLVYQPKVDLGSGYIIGAEALIRWHLEDGSVVSPVDFIPVAEESGLILPIGEWALREACRQLAEWREAGIDIKVAVNISARQFFEADLVEMTRMVLAEYGLSPASLVLELTESILIDNVETALEIVAQLRALGVSISIDDFGTGYSSLSYLKRFRVDEVKIDRSFVTDAPQSREDQALVYAVTYLAHEFGFSVCAEGVETPEQLGLLKDIACDIYQGYYFSRPVTPKAFADHYMRQSNADRSTG
ncbi:MAG: EAL domain-containing protein [Gammaproteobacteria bacterium]|nr:EAL domain-containing protein [Gammaproteobacteria bacterium]